MKSSWRIICIALLVVLLFSACGIKDTPISVSVVATPVAKSTSPIPSPSPVPPIISLLTIEPDMGGVKGYLDIRKAEWKNDKLIVFFCPFTPDASGENGVYILEPSIHPNTTLEGGYFQTGEIPPGKYVLVVGPMPETAVPLRENGQIKVFEVLAGQVLQIESVIY